VETINPKGEETARKAVSLGLTAEVNSLKSILEVGLKIAESVDGEPNGKVFPALLMAYYLTHFPNAIAELGNLNHQATIYKRLVWFAEEGSVQLSNMLLEVEKIDEGVDERRAVN
jgi:hypothetical protein